MALYSTVAFLERTARSTSWAILLCSAANAAACFAAVAASATLQGCGFGLRTGLGLGEIGGRMVPEAGDCWGLDVCGKCHAECRGSACRIMLLTNQARLPRNCRRLLLLKWVSHCIEPSTHNWDRRIRQHTSAYVSVAAKLCFSQPDMPHTYALFLFPHVTPLFIKTPTGAAKANDQRELDWDSCALGVGPMHAVGHRHRLFFFSQKCVRAWPVQFFFRRP
jgi:hypothetical protein